MKTQIEPKEDIMIIITKIHREFPELSKYIIEMPLNDAENEAVIVKKLESYYDSLVDLVDKYAKTHQRTVEIPRS